MLSCKQITEKASSYIDDELSFSQRLGYRLHLMMCHNCRRFLSNFRSGIMMLRYRHQQLSQESINLDSKSPYDHVRKRLDQDRN